MAGLKQGIMVVIMTGKTPQLIDTHCHIHDEEFEWSQTDMLEQAREAGVTSLICVGTSVKSSIAGAEYCRANEDTLPICYFSLALHPHEATNMDDTTLKAAWARLQQLARDSKNDPKFIAIGECGLDAFYPVDSDGLARQKWLLQQHLQLAQELGKPVIFHVREAFEHFWPIYDKFMLPGVMHSFSAGTREVEQTIQRGELYIGLNGIMTFTKDDDQLAAAKAVPLGKLMLETDAPFLTPTPLRGKINTPANVALVAEFLSDLRGETVSLLADQTSANARTLFGI